MTKAQRIKHKIGNQLRKAALLKLYHKVKPSERGWIENPGFIQDGKYTPMAVAVAKGIFARLAQKLSGAKASA